MTSRSTPTGIDDCATMTDKRGEIWKYSEPSDTWAKVHPGGVLLSSSRSYQKLQADFGPLGVAVEHEADRLPDGQIIEICEHCTTPLVVEAGGKRVRFIAHTKELCAAATRQHVRDLRRAIHIQAESFRFAAESYRGKVDKYLAAHGLPSLSEQEATARSEATIRMAGLALHDAGRMFDFSGPGGTGGSSTGSTSGGGGAGPGRIT